jgi:hypothetical protein
MCEAKLVLHERITRERTGSLSGSIDLPGIFPEQRLSEVRHHLPCGTTTGLRQLRELTLGVCSLAEPEAALSGKPERLCASLTRVDAVDDLLIAA